MRHFNRASASACFDRLGAHRRTGRKDKSSFKMLLMGVSNMLRVWHAMVQDDASDYPFPNTRHKVPDRKVPHCPPYVPDYRLKSYEPHHIDYMTIMLVSPGVPSYGPKRLAESCKRRQAIGGGALAWMVNNTKTPYDVVAVLVGSWDVAFTNRLTEVIEPSFEADVEFALMVWPRTTFILVTLPPCGGHVLTPGTAMHRKNETEFPKTKLHTPRLATAFGACDWIPEFNDMLRRIIRRQNTPRLELLDAHQMTTSRPEIERAGYPPGIWEEGQRSGFHFQAAFTRQSRDAARASNPPSAAGEMDRAIANRLLDRICPAL